jgi:hypothetical protein
MNALDALLGSLERRVVLFNFARRLLVHFSLLLAS